VDNNSLGRQLFTTREIPMRLRATFLTAALLSGLSASLPRAAIAQASRADSAAILLEAARQLDLQGQRAAADALLSYLIRTYPGTAAALLADSLFNVRSAEPERAGSGHVHLVAWSALHGAFLGVAIPAMLGAEGPEMYGLGLLAGGPGAFLLAQRYAYAHQPTSGQAAAMTFGWTWGLWQAVGWRAVLELGSGQKCTTDGFGTYCEDTSGRAVWGAMVAGSLGGLAAGTMIGNRVHPTAGRVAFATHGSYWGTWLGFVFTVLTDQEADDQTLTTLLLAGNLGLVAGASAAPADVSVGRVRITTALGLAGTAAGFGLDLILQPEDENTALLIPTATGIVGLAYGWKVTGTMDRRRRTAAPGGAAGAGGAALLERCGSCGSTGTAKWRIGTPVLLPALIPVGENARGRRVVRAGLAVPLVRAEY
jgi:hypothetical protein